MKITKVIRASEWWGYKIPPILILPYLILFNSNLKLVSAIGIMLFTICALIVGAVYVSILNDVTDIEEDKAAGKNNNMAKYSRVKQFLFLAVPISMALLFCWFLRKNSIALTFYLLSYLSFTLYSVPPFRLKKRGVLSLIADASGSQMLPTLFTVAVVSYHSHYQLSIVAILLIAVWSLCFGLRGILWHQFHDLENDIRSGLFTIVQGMSKTSIRVTGIIILTIELAAFFWLLHTIGSYYLYISLVLYILYMFYRTRKTDLEIIIMKYTRQNFDIIMNVYYQVFLPISILILISISRPEFLVLVALQILLFPSGFYTVIKNIF